VSLKPGSNTRRVQFRVIRSLIGRLESSHGGVTASVNTSNATIKEPVAMEFRTLVVLTLACLAMVLNSSAALAQNPVVVMETSEGTVTIELFVSEAPISVANFLKYVDEEHYDGTIFHRVIAGFMVQGGHFTPEMQAKPTGSQIKNEAENGLKNDKYTLAMARTNVVDSATDQFFINSSNNAFLNNGGRDFGYAVFGRVTDGMDVVDKIEGATVTESVPNTPIVIQSIRRQ
jgi:peptidyl-prolyl cis-trans isomerase A (cyclophilin A)